MITLGIYNQYHKLTDSNCKMVISSLQFQIKIVYSPSHMPLLNRTPIHHYHQFPISQKKVPWFVFFLLKNKTTLNTQTITKFPLYHFQNSTMEPKSTGKRIKTCAHKNATLYVVNSDSDSSDVKTLVNNVAHNRITKLFASISVIS